MPSLPQSQDRQRAIGSTSCEHDDSFVLAVGARRPSTRPGRPTGRARLSGHFRDITEASLLEEIASANALVPSDSEDDDDADDGNNHDELDDVERAGDQLKTREDLFKAKFEMLQHVQAANKDVMIALNFDSLLQSKDEPSQSTTTVSPSLKSTLPVRSLDPGLHHAPHRVGAAELVLGQPAGFALSYEDRFDYKSRTLQLVEY